MSSTKTFCACAVSRRMSLGSTVAITPPPRSSAAATTKASTAISDPDRTAPRRAPARTATFVSTFSGSTRSRLIALKTAASVRRPRTTSASTAVTVATGYSRRRASAMHARTASRRAIGRLCASADNASLSRTSISSPACALLIRLSANGAAAAPHWRPPSLPTHRKCVRPCPSDVAERDPTSRPSRPTIHRRQQSDEAA